MTRQFRERRYRIPITAQQISHRRARFDLGEAFVLFFADHALLPFLVIAYDDNLWLLGTLCQRLAHYFCIGSASIHSAFHVTIYFAPSLRRAIGRSSFFGISMRSESWTLPITLNRRLPIA